MEPSTSMWIAIAVIGLGLAGFMAWYFLTPEDNAPATTTPAK